MASSGQIQYDTLLLGTEGAEIVQRGNVVNMDTNVENKTALGAFAVQNSTFDQSGSTTRVKGKRNVNAVANHFEGCEDIHIVQDNVVQHIEGGGDNSVTTADYIHDTQGLRCNKSNSTTIVDGRRGGKNSITAGRIIGGNSSVTINESNTVTIIRS